MNLFTTETQRQRNNDFEGLDRIILIDKIGAHGLNPIVAF
jgi:hypothetical protein